jgi:Domain of unknown function (DUF4136)
MKRASIFFSLMAILALGGVGAWAQKVNVDWDQTANFQGYGTYAWAKGTPAKNQLMDERIVAAVDKELTAKGLQKVAEGASPSLLVTYHAAVNKQTQLDTTNMGGYGWGWGGGGSATTTVKEIPVGELIVDIGDPKTKKMLWRGTATETLSDNPQKVADKIDKSVEDMFKKFPPPPKK